MAFIFSRFLKFFLFFYLIFAWISIVDMDQQDNRLAIRRSHFRVAVAQVHYNLIELTVLIHLFSCFF